jgi:hypothetical protein
LCEIGVGRGEGGAPKLI